jgi:FkbM family methyltransferase
VVTSEREITRLDDLTSEADFLKRILAAVRPRGVVYDIGANIGVLSLAVAGHHRQDGVVVHAIEPEPRNAAELDRNIALNGLGRVVVHRCALGATCGRATLYVEGETGSGAHSLVSDHANARRAVEVEVLAAAEFARRIASPPDLVKIDVEGAELEVLRGLTPLLEERPPHDVFVEVHPDTLARAGGSPQAVRELLETRGYRCVWRQRRGRQFHEHYQHA